MSPAHVGESLDRSQIESFLKTCIDSMMSEGARKTLKERSSGCPSSSLVRIQKNVCDERGIDPEVGLLAITRIEENFPGDIDLISLKQEFDKSINVARLQCLEDRRPQTPTTKKKMPWRTVLEFLEALVAKFDSTEVQERLAKHIKDTKATPDPVVQQVLDETMELLGYEAKHGQASFQKFFESQDFLKDEEAASAYKRWLSKRFDVCISLLNKYDVDGAEKEKVRVAQAKDEIHTMRPEEWKALMRKNEPKLAVLQQLPADARQRHFEKLSEEEKLELVKAEIFGCNFVKFLSLQA